jgi:ribosomal protein S18 acetylase RimI-like enzyme
MILLERIALRDFFLLFKWVNNKESAHLTRKFIKTSLWSHAKWFLKHYKSDKHLIFKIHDSDSRTDIGLIQILTVDSSAELRIKIIPSNLRGKGFGSQTLQKLIEKAGSEGLSSIYLFVRRDNLIAINLYRKYGFDFVPNSDFMGEYSDGFFTTSKMILEFD